MAVKQDWSDRKIELLVGKLLRTGVLLSAFVVLVGAVIYLVNQGHRPASYRAFKGEPSNLRNVAGIFREAIALRGNGIIQLGLLLLIGTPVARVAFSIFGFAEEKDRTYVFITCVVLTVLLFSLVGHM
ncbi:MAG: DUF1634 domain-containing protein [Candidatus Sulfotelmatobacter sp.]